MKKVGIIAMILGAFIVLGSVGQSDFETFSLLEGLQIEETPFWQIMLRCFAGIVLLAIGIRITIRQKKRRNFYHIGGRHGRKKVYIHP